MKILHAPWKRNLDLIERNDSIRIVILTDISDKAVSVGANTADFH